MKSSWVYERPRVPTKDPAVGYSKGKTTPYEEYYGCPPYKNEFWLCCGGSGIWSSVEDLARWDLAWRDGKLFKPSTIKLAPRALENQRRQNGQLWVRLEPDVRPAGRFEPHLAQRGRAIVLFDQ